MSKKILEDVFGIQRDVPLNYTKRSEVDFIFIESLSRKQHIVIYGSSKQGKTCLRKSCLDEQNYIVVQCSNKINLSQLNELILKQAGFTLTVSDKKTVGGISKVSAIFGFKLFAKAEFQTELERNKENAIDTKPLDLDLEDVNDVILALNSIKFQKFIILEDFHYLKLETQRDFAVALKAYYDSSSFSFIIVGVWLEENRLIALNGDLGGRVVSVNTDDWIDDNLKEVIAKGCQLLNIEFDERLTNKIIEESFYNVSFVQETCYRICKEFKIKQTVETDNKKPFLIEYNFDIESIIKNIVSKHSGRYKAFITRFSEGFENTESDIYRWILYPILISSIYDLEDGISYTQIFQKIISKHSQSQLINNNNLSHSLDLITTLQLEKNIRPNVIDYDQMQE